jgi:predicted Zn-dependent protease
MKIIHKRAIYFSGLLLFTIFLTFYLGCTSPSTYVPLDRSRLHGSGEILFVPIGGVENSTLQELRDFYRQKYGLEIEIKPPLAVPSAAYDNNRRQLIAESVTEAMRRAYPFRDVNGPILIGITGRDMYIQGKNWSYAFSFRREDGVAVVSTARMDHGFMGLWKADQETQKSRLRKMVTKNIGVLYYRLPLSQNPQSVMYGNVGGPQELDRMGEDF